MERLLLLILKKNQGKSIRNLQVVAWNKSSSYKIYVMLDMRTKKPKSKTVFYWCDGGRGESWQKGNHSMGS